MIQDKIIEHLNKRLDNFREQLRISDSVIKEQEQLIEELRGCLLTPKYKLGNIVRVLGMEGIEYKVDCFMYDQSYPIYNLVNTNDETDIQTIPEVDILPWL